MVPTRIGPNWCTSAMGESPILPVDFLKKISRELPSRTCVTNPTIAGSAVPADSCNVHQMEVEVDGAPAAAALYETATTAPRVGQKTWTLAP